jgi:CheY-like chemotaxis protein
VAKILVADDNSNIQRMVGLALKDQGIDVVAVGNGEAAVRKISELRPDLVLADVFMPVRNGYEVCQYVKEDASLAHIPVILLVGAFDPLDEQEAQRVGADGVLKKPFVPPDPLIAMVKAALQRAGVSLTPGGGEKSAEKSATSLPRKAIDLLPHAPPPAVPIPPPPMPTSPLAGISFSSGPAPFSPVVSDESFVDEPAAPEPVNVDESKHTLAFGNLLGAATATEDPGLATDVEIPKGSDWRSMDEEPDDVPEEEEEEAKESAPSWRRDGADTVFADDGSGVKDWRDSAVVETAGRKSARETWESGSKSGFESAAEVSDEAPANEPPELGAFASEMSALEAESAVESSPKASVAEGFSEETTQSNSSAHGEKASDASAGSGDTHIASVEQSDMPGMKLPRADAGETQTIGYVNGESSSMEKAVEVPKEQHAEIVASDVAVSSATGIVEEEVAASVATVPAVEERVEQEPAQVEEPLHAEEKTSEPVAINSWFSRPASPWDTDVQKSPLTSTWDAPSVAAAASESVAAEDAPEGRATNGQSSHEEVATVISDEPAVQAAPAASENTASVDTDALIAKILSRMSPDVMQTLTRELLKPMVAALVEDELKNKK